MKKKMILMLTLLAGVLTANADNVVSVSAADVSSEGTGFICVNLDNSDVVYSYQFDVVLPDGFSFVLDGDDNPVAEAPARNGKLAVSSSQIDGHTARFLAVDTKGGTLSGTTGAILYVKVETTLASGEGAAKLTGITLSKKKGGDGDDKDQPVKETPADIDFDLEVFDGVVLYEESTENPKAASNVNVKVLRTIEAGEWSTICLPFDMTAAQVKAAFGDDVELKDFDCAEATSDAISVKFVDATAIAKNTPYLIKVSSDISEFTADAVTIKNGSIKKEDEDGNQFKGTHKKATVPDEALFINGNKFYYSTGKTKINAFRCWFVFTEILDAYYDAGRSIIIDFGDDTTGINAIHQLPNDGNYYNLKGQRVEKPSKGIYILNGKKVVVK